MKPSLYTLLLTVVIGAIAAPGPEPPLLPAKAPASIELRDQFDQPQKLCFPATNITLLTIADKKGSEQIAAWVAPLQQRFGGRIDIRGLADVSSVPRPLRGMVRAKFQKRQTYPVMLDWSGEAVKAFTCVPDQANLLVLDRQGRVLKRFSGAATPRAIEELGAVIEQAIANRVEAPPKP